MTAVFDYIIIGAGSAGCVLANRLSENPKVSIAILEAGGMDTHPFVHMPIGAGKATIDPKTSWNYKSQAEPQLGNRKVLLPRGKVIGGSSSINGMIYIRGHPKDYDQWEADGAKGWSWRDLLPYFKKSEANERGTSDLHGADGPIHISNLIETDPTSDAVIRAFHETGVPLNDDFNGALQEGVGYYQATIKNGRRSSAAGGYLRPVLRRPNLDLETNAHVRRIIFNGKIAVGVEFEGKVGVQTWRAAREILLCAGAYQSPQILQLSGVGDGEHLRNLGVETLADRPEVGHNLQDHVMAPMAWRLKKGVFSYNQEFGGLKVLWNVLRYYAAGRGPMTIPTGHIGAFIKSNPTLERPDIQFHCLPVTGDLEASARGNKAALTDYNGLTMGGCYSWPESRGTSFAGSPDPMVPPHVTFNYLSTEKDRAVTVKAMRIARNVAAAPALQAFIENEEEPGAAAQSDEDLLEFTSRYGVTLHHPVGTCRMGSDNGAVVDCDLHVRGVERLRVIDASVMPTLITGNTNAATIAIAEKAADIIIRDR